MKQFKFLILLFFTITFLINSQSQIVGNRDLGLENNTANNLADIAVIVNPFGTSIELKNSDAYYMITAPLVRYLKLIGFHEVYFSTDDFTAESSCDIVTVDFVFELSDDGYYVTNMKTVWYFCDNTQRTLESDEYIYLRYITRTDIHNRMYSIIWNMNKPIMSLVRDKRLIARHPTSWTENSIKKEWETSGIDLIEGIYEQSESNGGYRYKIGVIKNKEGYNIIYLSGATYPNDWEHGELKAVLIPTAIPNFFKTSWYMADKTVNNDYYISFEQGIMKLIKDDGNTLYVKMYPTANNNLKPKDVAGTGTGVAITSNGLIVTNNHVIDGTSSIKVKGINGDFSKSYKAKVLISDKNNDLAIIKIEDTSFSTLGIPPYSILTSARDVGSNIFVLGFPLTATMGDEVKLTNGIISSKSGFQGDITAYQITAPIQPGNSGAPLFDKNGYLIGIVNAKHKGAENAGYAIKSIYLKNLIEALTPVPKLTSQNLLIGKPLIEQVKLIKKFVYIIEVD